MTSMCDKCYAPGACCKGFHLSAATTWADEGIAAARELAAERQFPFEPLHPTEVEVDENGRAYHSWRWACTKLGADGRCTIYEDRPALCRIFEPLSDPLCVHWHGAESDERSTLA